MKTPWNPSRRATARVTDALPIPDVHADCGGIIGIRHHSEVYGRACGEWPWLYMCDRCGSRVGMHPFTAIPLGTVADNITRESRKRAKAKFEPLWRGDAAQMTRSDAYAWLAGRLGLTPAECHFGLFDTAMCRRAHMECTQMLATTTTDEGKEP